MDTNSDSLSEDSLTETSTNIDKQEGKGEETIKKDKEEKQNVQEGSVLEKSKDSGQPEGGQVRKEQTPLPTTSVMVEQVCTGPGLGEESRSKDEGQSADRYTTSTPALSLEQLNKKSDIESSESHTAMEGELLIADSPITLDLSAQSSQVTSLSLEEGPKIICRVMSNPTGPVVSLPEKQEESDEEQFFSTGNDSLDVGGRVGEDGNAVVKDENIIWEDVEKFGSDSGMEPSSSLETPDSENRKHKEKNVKKQVKKMEKEGEKKRSEEKAEEKRGKKKQEERTKNPGDPAVIEITDQANLDTISMSDTTVLLHTMAEGEGSAGRDLGTAVDIRPTPTSTITTPYTTARALTPLDDDDDDDNVGGNNENLEDDGDDDEGCQGDDANQPARQLLKTSDMPKWPKGLLSELKMATGQSRHQILGSRLPGLSSYSRTSRQPITTIEDQFPRRYPFSKIQPHLESLRKHPIGYYLDDDEDEVSVLFLCLL